MIEVNWLVELALRSSLILVLAALASTFLKSAAWRHLVWACALCALVFVPLLMSGLPSVTVPVLPPVSTPGPVSPSAEILPPGAPERQSVAPPVVQDPARVEESLGATPVGPAPEPAPVWTSSLLQLWAVVAGILALAMASDRLRRRNLTSGARPLASDAWREDLASLGGTARLLTSAKVDVPVTWGLTDPVILLPSGAEGWSASLRRHVLLHELAHVERCDATIFGLARFACALHWFNPLAWWALRRLAREAELAADDRVLRAGATASSYAGDLVAFARRLRRPLPRAVTAMARRSSPLETRVEAILDPDRARSAPRSGRLLLALAATGLIVLPAAALLRPERRIELLVEGGGSPRSGVETPPEPIRLAMNPTPAPTPAAVQASVRTVTTTGDAGRLADCGESQGASIHADDDSMRLSVRSEHCKLAIETEGKIDYAPDDSGVVSMGRSARLEIDEQRGGTRRRLVVTPGPNGEPDYQWSVDRQERIFDADARAWLREVLPEVFRSTGLNAEERVTRILADRGVPGVLAEIALIGSDYVARLYHGHLLELGDLDTAELVAWIELAGQRIGSDYELAETLTSLPPTRLLEPGVDRTFVEAATTIGSDYELRRTLAGLLEVATPTRATLDKILSAAQTIGSDYEQAELLVAVASRYPSGESLPDSYYRAAKSIGSDYELRRALTKALERPLSDATLHDLLVAARSIGSDYELAELLVVVGRQYRLEGAAREAFVAALDTVGSDHEYRRAERALRRDDG